jgi:hypothetical protein
MNAAGLSEAMAELLVHYRQQVDDLDNQIELMESGAIRFLRGPHDATAEAIERARGQKASLLEALNKHDPDGLTALPSDPE